MRALAHILAVVALAVSLASAFSVAPVQAQPVPVDGTVEDAEWTLVAERAETAVQNARASDRALADLRAELVEWRDRFDAARSVNEEAIATVQAQLDTLGPAPEGDATEAPEIAAQRTELQERLSALQAPARRADVAHSRADALIRNIDRILRDRQTERLLELGPSPLNPIIWPGAVAALAASSETVVEELVDGWRNEVRRAQAREHLPAVLILFAVAAVFLSRGRRWIELLMQRVHGQERRAERFLLGLLLSLGQIVLPLAGMIALVTGITLTGLAGPHSLNLLHALPEAMALFVLARWAGAQDFPHRDTPPPPLLLEPQQRLEGRIYSVTLGLILAASVILDELARLGSWSPETANVIRFPLLVLAGFILVRIAQLLRLHAGRLSEEGEGDQPFRRRLALFSARIIVILAVVGPVLAGIGYFNAGTAIVFPTIRSLLAIAILTVLQRMATEFYVLVSRNREGAREALTPVLAGFVLVLVSMPVFALIWGARVTDLTELWERFRAGITIGETTISPGVFLTFAIVFALGFVVTRAVQGTLRASVLPKTQLDIGAQTAIVSGLGYVGIFLAALIAITSAGLDLSSLAIVAGALSVGIGFGLQNIVSNFVSGIILLIERPVSEGDWIEVGPNMGFVRSISVRSTRIETFDRRDVIVPNADLISGTVTNWTRGNLVGRCIIPVGVAYGTDTRRVEKILQEIAEAQPIVLLNPPPFIYFKGFGASSLDFEIRAILRDVTQILVVENEVKHAIAERFAAEGIEIPFAQQDIWLRNPEAFSGRPAPAPEAGTSNAGASAALDRDDLVSWTDSEDGEGEGDGR